MNKKGISAVALAIAVVVLIILISTVSVSITYSVSNAKKRTFAEEIYNIQSIVNEYIKKENVVPASVSTIQIEPSDLNQFEGEKITDGKLLLNILELTELDITNTLYGNKKIGETDTQKEKDIYAVSTETGKVYYIAGFKDGDKTYYTLTDELLDMIEKKQNLLISEKTIVFTPSKLGWSNEGVSVIATVPQDYEITSFEIDNSNITYIEETIDNVKTYTINSTKLLENYEILIKYTRNGIEGNVKYKTKLDTVVPTIFKDENIANSSIAINGIKATDTESGVKYFKYAEGIINDSNVKEYMASYGKKINKSSINMKNKSVYTIYAEDKAGNYAVLHLDGDGQRFYPTVATTTGTSEVTLSNCYNLSLINYKIYGNSIQDGVPSPTDPVEIQSVGEKTKNLFAELNKGVGLNVTTGVENVNDTWATSDYIKVDFTENESYYLSGLSNNLYSFVAAYNSNKEFLGRTSATGREYLQLTNNLFSSGTSQGTGDISYIRVTQYENVNLSGGINDVDKLNIQLEEGTTATTYEPYGYKIPITVRGKNFIPKFKTETKNGITLDVNEDGSIHVYGTATATTDFYSDFSVPQGTYHLSGCPAGGSTTTYRMLVYFKDVSYNLIDYGSGNSYTLTTQSTVRCQLRVYIGTEIDAIFKPMLESGNTLTYYEPYVEPKTYNIYLNEPLRRVGSYIDYIDFESKSIVRNIKSETFNENSTWEKSSSNSYRFMSYVDNKYQVSSTTPKLLSNRFVYNGTRNIGAIDLSYNASSGATTGKQLVFGLNLESLEDLKNWVASNNIVVDYPVPDASPVSISLPEISLNYGTNIISVDTTIAPYQADITYYKKQ